MVTSLPGIVEAARNAVPISSLVKAPLHAPTARVALWRAQQIISTTGVNLIQGTVWRVPQASRVVRNIWARLRNPPTTLAHSVLHALQARVPATLTQQGVRTVQQDNIPIRLAGLASGALRGTTMTDPPWAPTMPRVHRASSVLRVTTRIKGISTTMETH